MTLLPELWVFRPMEPVEPVLLALLVRGDVTPTWVLMPLLQEPVCDTEGVFLPEPPLSDSSDTSEGFRRLHLEAGSILTPLSDPPSNLFTSSPGQVWCIAVEAECFSASVTGWEHTYIQFVRKLFKHIRAWAEIILLKIYVRETLILPFKETFERFWEDLNS